MIPAASVLLALRSHGAPVRVPSRTAAGFCIAIQCWSFREHTLFEAIEMAAWAGASAIEMFPGQEIGGGHRGAKLAPGMPDELFDAISGKLAEHGLAACNYGISSISEDETEARPVFELARRFGMEGVTTESIEAIDTLEALAMEYGIKVCFHNHPKPTKLWNPDTVSKAIQGRHANLGFCADLGHWASSGLDPLEAVGKHASRIHSIHIKDREKTDIWTHDRPLGTGAMPLAAILDELLANGFRGSVVIEFEHNWKNNLAEIAQCVGFLRGYSSRGK